MSALNSNNGHGDQEGEPSGRPAWLSYVWIPILGLLLLIAGSTCLLRREKDASPVPSPVAERIPDLPKLRPPLTFIFPTAQDKLLKAPAPGILMPTASGRPESGMYGSVRSRQQGKYVRPSFHEGIDIAPLERDRAGRALDEVMAVADGRVAYINKHSGNSNYGIYVVLVHEDPLGDIYSLYGHLSKVDAKLVRGQRIVAGTTMGVMGNTPPANIPVERSHTHLEIGFISNSRFDRWARARRLTPDHGIYNGQNFLGVDPLEFFKARDSDGRLAMTEFVKHLKPAFELTLNKRGPLDFYLRYPGLWKKGGQASGVMTLKVCEGGIPFEGRPATEDEKQLLGRKSYVIHDVDTDEIGRNGRRIIVQKGKGWGLGENGEKWFAVLMY